MSYDGLLNTNIFLYIFNIFPLYVKLNFKVIGIAKEDSLVCCKGCVHDEK